MYDGFSRIFDGAKGKLLDLIRGENSIRRRKLALSEHINITGALKIAISEVLNSSDLTLAAFINQSIEHLLTANYSNITDVSIIQDLLHAAYFIEGLATVKWNDIWVQPLQALVVSFSAP